MTDRLSYYLSCLPPWTCLRGLAAACLPDELADPAHGSSLRPSVRPSVCGRGPSERARAGAELIVEFIVPSQAGGRAACICLSQTTVLQTAPYFAKGPHSCGKAQITEKP